MEFTLKKGEAARISEYIEVFQNSKLYDAYFAGGDMLEQLLEESISADALYIAVDKADQPIGVMYMTMGGMCGLPYLHLLGVRADCRGKGVGRSLVQIFINVAEELGYPNMFIMTSKFNRQAKQLYESMGFQPQCLLRDLMKKGVSEWLMMRPNSGNSGR